MGRRIRMAVLAAVTLGGGEAAGAAAQAAPAAVADFNGDGIDDLVVGVPGEDLGGDTDAGVVDVVYGSESGLPDGGREQLTQANPETGDAYGAALAPGNFDGNEFPDVAVGAPGETVGVAGAAGAADARDGGLDGLPAGPDAPLYFQSSDGVPGNPEAGDLFAAALGA